MEKIVLHTDFIKIIFDEDLNLYTSVYLPATINMTDHQWESQMLELKKLIGQLKPLYIIDDNTNRKYGYSPSMQKWTLNLFVSLWNDIGLKKYAQVLPNEILGRLTSMQIEDLAVNDFEMKYQYKMFEDYQSAINWIKE